MPHTFINEIEPGQSINDIYIAKDPVLRSTTRGDFYIAMYLVDKTGQMNGRMWQATQEIYNSLPKPGFVHINGRSELYKDNLQLIINSVAPVDSSNISLEDFLPRTTKDVKKLYEEIKRILGGIKNEQVRALIGEFMNDKELMSKFVKAPAAAKLHHGYLGGLLEHTCNTLKVAEAILPFYPELESDLVLAGLFLHDIGKTDELEYEMTFSYSDRGQLVGHIVMAVLMLQKKVDELASKGAVIDKTIVDSLSHILLSHHGQYEFGSPKLPAMGEAFMVNYIDDMDSKIFQVQAAIDNEQDDSDWTSWQRALETRIYKKRINSKD